MCNLIHLTSVLSDGGPLHMGGHVSCTLGGRQPLFWCNVDLTYVAVENVAGYLSLALCLCYFEWLQSVTFQI